MSNGIILKPSFRRDAVTGLPLSPHGEHRSSGSFEHCGSHPQDLYLQRYFPKKSQVQVSFHPWTYQGSAPIRSIFFLPHLYFKQEGDIPELTAEEECFHISDLSWDLRRPTSWRAIKGGPAPKTEKVLPLELSQLLLPVRHCSVALSPFSMLKMRASTGPLRGALGV